MPARPTPLTIVAAVALAAAGASLGAGGTGPVAALTGSSTSTTAPAGGAVLADGALLADGPTLLTADPGRTVELIGGTAAAPGDPGERGPLASSRAAQRPALLPGDPQAREQADLLEVEARRAEEEAARTAAIAAAQVERETVARAAEQARAAAAAEAERVAVAQAALADPRGTARGLAVQRGWGEDQFTCLDRLWTRESGWQWDADNPTSSAYGIPQSLPGEKMASAGADWQSNPHTQIRWGLQYIGEVYGAPCGAWAHSEAVNWY